jgi:hypothetical protein
LAPAFEDMMETTMITMAPRMMKDTTIAPSCDVFSSAIFFIFFASFFSFLFCFVALFSFSFFLLGVASFF